MEEGVTWPCGAIQALQGLGTARGGGVERERGAGSVEDGPESQDHGEEAT